VFDIEKLRWFNRQYLLNLPADEISKSIIDVMEAAVIGRELKWDYDTGVRLVGLVRERISVYRDTGSGTVDH